MIQIRRNVFETNSSSTHSVSITNPELVPSELTVVEDYDICDGDATVVVRLEGFCGGGSRTEQESKLAYLILQLMYLTGNSRACGWYCSNSEEVEQAREEFYNTDEFEELETEICQYVGCKHLRVYPGSEGYIDHDSVVYDLYELKDECHQSYANLIFAKDSDVWFEFNG